MKNDTLWNLGNVNYCFVVGDGKDREEMSEISEIKEVIEVIGNIFDNADLLEGE